MLRAFQILASHTACAASLLALTALAACGQRGPLFLPSDVPASARATLPQTLRPGGVLQPAAPAPVPAPVSALQAPALSLPFPSVSSVPAAPVAAPSSASVPP